MRDVPHLVSRLILFALLIVGLGLVANGSLGCGGNEPVEEDPYTDFDYELQQRLERDLPTRTKPNAFLGNNFDQDRPELLAYAADFENEQLSQLMRERLIRYATEHGDPFLRANMSYLLVLAGYTEVHADVLANLNHGTEYLRYRAVLALPHMIGPHEADVLVPLIGGDERADRVRDTARRVYRELVGPEQAEEVFAALRDSGTDGERAAYLAGVLGELLDEMAQGPAEELMRDIQQRFGQRDSAVDGFVLMRLAGTFGAEHVPALARIAADAEAEPAQRVAAHGELVRLLEQGSPAQAQAVHNEAHTLRRPVLAELAAEEAEPVFEPEAVYALIDPLGLDEESVELLQALVQQVDLAEWRQVDEADVVATRLLANHAPRSEWLTEKLIEGMENPKVAPAASLALLRYARELETDSPEQVTLVESAKRGLVGTRSEAAGVAQRLAGLGSEAAVDALLQGLEQTNRDVVEVCTEALLRLENSDHLSRARYYTLWEMVREERRDRYEEYQVVHALRVLQVIGDQSDLEFFENSCAIEATSGELRTAFDEAVEAIGRRVGG